MANNYHSLAQQWMPYVRKIARIFSQRQNLVEYDDLVSAGYEALVCCERRFDEERLGTHLFIGYARQRVTGAMLDCMRNADCVGRAARRRIKETHQGSDEVRHRVDMSELDKVASDSSVSDSNGVLRIGMRRALESMDSRTRIVFERRIAGESNEEIGRDFGVSYGRISQLFHDACAQLRANL